MSSAINIAWGKRDAHGWTCPCREQISILAASDTQPYELHCKGKKHRAGIAPAAKGHQTSMMRFFSQPSQGSQPSHHESSTASQPSNEPSSPRSGASIEPLVELPVLRRVPTKCMGVLPLGISSALVLRGCYPLMRHAHEKVQWFYVDGVGCFSHGGIRTNSVRGTAIMARFVMCDLQDIRPCNIFFPRCACKRYVVRQCAPSTYTHTHHHTNTQTVVPLRTNLLWQANVAQRSSTSML